MLITDLTVKNGRLVEKRGRSKFNVGHDDPRRLYNGVKYDSIAEAHFAQQLDIHKAAGEIVAIERQVVRPLVVNCVAVTKMKIDFRITHKGGQQEYVEVKGAELPEWKLKVKLLRALDPGILYRVVHAADQRAIAGKPDDDYKAAIRSCRTSFPT